jgi:hypothetical protein
VSTQAPAITAATAWRGWHRTIERLRDAIRAEQVVRLNHVAGQPMPADYPLLRAAIIEAEKYEAAAYAAYQAIASSEQRR